MIRILIADDQVLFADMLKSMLQTYDDLEVTAYARNGCEAIILYEEYHPNLCLFDIQMPDGGGLMALKHIKDIHPEAKIIMLTTFSDDQNIISAYLYGADGYLLKDILPDTLIHSIQCVMNGLSVMSKEVQTLIVRYMAEQNHREELTSNITTGENSFTERDIHIICGIANGMSNKAIAEQLNYSEGTVRNRISRLLTITGLTDRTQIALFAIKNRLI